MLSNTGLLQAAVAQVFAAAACKRNETSEFHYFYAPRWRCPKSITTAACKHNEYLMFHYAYALLQQKLLPPWPVKGLYQKVSYGFPGLGFYSYSPSTRRVNIRYVSFSITLPLYKNKNIYNQILHDQQYRSRGGTVPLLGRYTT